MRPWLKVTLFLVVVFVVALAWMVFFHNEAVAERLPKWAWLQKTVARLGEHKKAGEDADEGGGENEGDGAKNEIPVHTAKVTVATLHKYIEGIGVVSPRAARAGEMAGSANLASPVAGVVSQVLCAVGQKVKAGEAVIQLDDRVAKAAEEQAAAGLAQAQASLAALKATPRPDQLQIAQLNVEKAQAALQFAQKNFDRQKLLSSEEGVSGKTLEQAQMELSAAKTDVTVNQKQLALLKSQPTPEDLRQEEAKVAQAQAALGAARAQHQMMTITAPIDATVEAVSVNPGEGVDTTKTLVQLVALDRLMVDVDVPAEQLPAAAKGLKALVSVSGKPAGEGVVTGTVTVVSPQVDPKTGGVALTIDLPADSGLRPGLSVRVRVVTEEHKDCLVVPREAVVADENGDSVVSVIDGDRATHQTVTTGLEENGMIEISADGIAEGVRVATAGAFGLPAATRVKLLD
jgi:membrane fusion protein (multidrug efflux system)